MIKNIVNFGVAAGVAIALTGGVASAQATIDETGPGSANKVKIVNIDNCKVVNKNNVAVLNLTAQKAKTGKAKVKMNNTGGNATSGTAANTNSTTTDVAIVNNENGTCGCGCELSEGGLQGGSITNTGPRSWNSIIGVNKNSNTTINSNNVLLGNATLQYASSGNASVSWNTTGGNATSGNAVNTNTSNVTLTISNN